MATATPVPPGPPSDEVSTAALIGSLPFTSTQDTTWATVAETDPDTGVGLGVNTHTVWYRFVAPSPGLVTADTLGSSYDTVLVAFSGSPGNLTLVVGNDDIDDATTASRITFSATQGTTYYLEAAGFNEGGTLRLNVAMAVAPPNDDIASATVIGGFPYTTTQNTVGATMAATDPDLGTGLGVGTNTVWYRLVAPSSGFVQADTFGSFYDTVLAAFSGSPGNLTLVAGNDDFEATTLLSRIVFNVTGGTTYYLEVAGLDEAGDLRLNVDFGTTLFPTPTAMPAATGTAIPTATVGPGPTLPPTPTRVVATATPLPPAGAPPNDDIGSAVPIPGFPYSGSLDTSRASVRPTDPNMGDGLGLNLNTVWYRFVAPSAGGVTANTFGSNYDTVLAAYSGSAGNLARAAANDDDSAAGRQSRIIFDVVGGTTYYLEVGGYEGGGTLRLSVAFSPFTPFNPPANDDFNSATAIGGSPFNAIQDTRGATTAADDPDMTASTGVNSNTVWYRLTAPASGPVRASTLSSDYDTVLAAFTGARGSLTPVAGSDDAGATLQSQFTFDAVAGMAYYLEAAGYSSGGILRLAVDYAVPTATPAPTATPTPPQDGGGSGGDGGTGGGGPGPAPTEQPRPADTPVPPQATQEPEATRQPEPTRAPEPTERPAVVSIPTPGPSIEVREVTGSPPGGVPAPSPEGVVALLPGDRAGSGFVRSAPAIWGGANTEVRVDNQGQPLAVSFQPVATPPQAALPPNTRVARAFSLEVYNYDSATNSAQPRTEAQKDAAAPVVVRMELTQQELDSLPTDAAGHPDTSLLAVMRVLPEGSTVQVPTTWVPNPNPPPAGEVVAVFVPRSTYLLVVLPSGHRVGSVPADARYFSQTGYRVNRDAFWDYFQKRGGVRTFGYPISREFTLLGLEVQMFQRGILQRMPDGGVARMNLLDEGLMPYTRINFSSFPGPDRTLIETAPLPGGSDYGERAMAFLRVNVPDQWEGMPVNFLRTFLSTVRFEDAFPEGDGDPALAPLLNLELWGLPTSKPAYDPNNRNFVYQRFQRGILHFDASSGATQGLLLADYLKGIITGQNLPSDLAEQARESRFFKQYDRTKPGHMARAADLPGTSLVDAFEPEVPREAVASALSADALLVSIPMLAALLLGIRPKGVRRRK